MNTRPGRFITQAGAYKAFIPNPLPPKPGIRYDEELRLLLSKADRSLARLDGITTVLPNPDLFIAMYVKKEALLSSQIEGTQASLEGILEFESNLPTKDDINEIIEVVNYIKALDYGIRRIKEFPLSLRLIKEIHGILLKGTRGGSKGPGEFRTSQNWIGPPGAALAEAAFIPPPPDHVLSSLGELEQFIHMNDMIPPLTKIALIHSQFETIHPFLDGNGRIGRLLITFYLFWKGILSRPLLYLSLYFKKNRIQYYEMLNRVRTEGDFEGWAKFFLKAVIETSEEAAQTSREIIQLKDRLISQLYEGRISSIHAVKLIDLLFEKPLTTVRETSESLKISKEAANELVNKFEKIGILKEATGKKRYKRYHFQSYLEIIAKGTK